jgi:hypothetical protein
MARLPFGLLRRFVLVIVVIGQVIIAVSESDATSVSYSIGGTITSSSRPEIPVGAQYSVNFTLDHSVTDVSFTSSEAVFESGITDLSLSFSGASYAGGQLTSSARVHARNDAGFANLQDEITLVIERSLGHAFTMPDLPPLRLDSMSVLFR